MPSASRRRLSRIVRTADCDLAEAALLCCVEHDPSLDVDAQLLRIDALADGLRSSGFEPGADPVADARGIASYLRDTLGFTGDVASYHDPRNALLSEVLDRKRGLPITLSILYVALGRRLGVRTWGIGLPGHFVVGVAADERPVVVDPFHDGRLLDEADLGARVRELTGGQLAYSRNMLRPIAPAAIIRRVLNNLTRDFTTANAYADALWSVELKQLLPGTVPDDHRARGELLLKVGRFDEAAEAFESYIAEAEDPPDAVEVSRQAIHARAKMN